MSIEIKDVRLILPALVSFKQNEQEYTVFVYIDHAKKDIVIPDISDISDVEEFKKAFIKHYNSKNPISKTPVLPSKDIFNKIDPNNFTGGDFSDKK
jgi:hypothetical protein